MTIRAQIESLIKNEVLESANGEYFREPLAGFASADDPLFSRLKETVGPHHIHPRDLLPEAKTVVSCACFASITVLQKLLHSKGSTGTGVMTISSKSGQIFP